MTSRVVRVLPDVPAIDKVFDYLVPDELGDQVRVGTIVRIVLHGRRVRGWVVAEEVEAAPGVELRPIAKVTGWGPPAELLELASWAAWRWAGRSATLLRTASPPTAVRQLPAPSNLRMESGAEGQVHAQVRELLLDGGPAVLRLPPAADRLPVVLAAAALGPTLVLCPTAPMARAAANGLSQAGVSVAVHPEAWAAGAAGATVVGTRAAAWAAVKDLAAVVVFDEHDEALQQEQAPTWHARDVALERAHRAGAPCLLTSACPSLEALRSARLVEPSRAVERAGWPALTVADRREEEPGRAGAMSPALRDLLHEGGRVLCVLNRTGRARLLACTACAELARCERCGAAVEQPDEEQLRCRGCATERPLVCLACGATRFKSVRAGVSRVREDLEALLREPVAEVTGSSDPGAAGASRVVVGTEALLRQVGRADAVAFLDFDQELLAPRYRAAEQALGLLARAARIVSAGRPGESGRGAGRLLVQTRLPEHEVVQAVLRADPARVAGAEAERRALLGFPPTTAMAAVSGPSAAAFMDGFSQPGVEVLGPADGTWLLRAPDHTTLCDALAATSRPPGRLRVEVDPLRL